MEDMEATEGVCTDTAAQWAAMADAADMEVDTEAEEEGGTQETTTPTTAMEVDTVADMEVTVVDTVVDMEVMVVDMEADMDDTVVDMEADMDDEEATVDMEADTEVIIN